MEDTKADPFELLAIAGRLSSTTDLDHLLRKAGEAACGLLDSEASSVLLVTRDGKNLYFKVASGDKGQILTTMTVPMGRGVAGWVAKNRKPEIVNDVNADAHFLADFDKATGFETRSLLAAPMIHAGELVGVLEVLNRRSGPYGAEHAALLGRLADFAAATIVNTRTVAEHKNFFAHMLELVSLASEATMPGMAGHSARSAKLARALGRTLDMDDYSVKMLQYAAILHDVGYIAFNHQAFLEEMGVKKVSEDLHPSLSAKLLEGIAMFEPALPMILHHHERFDGKGFPAGLAGEAIPLGARILCLTEAVEELRMAGLRGADLYRKAVQEAGEGSGKTFDPVVARAFIEMIEAQTTAW